MKRGIFQHIFALLCLFAVLATVSFAWMLGNQDVETVGRIVVDYDMDTDEDGNREHNLSVASQALEFDVLLADESGEYTVPFEKEIKGLVPGRTLRFVMRFENTSGSVMDIGISVGGMTANFLGEEGESILYYTYMNLYSEGDLYQGVSPSDSYKCLGEGLEGLPGAGGHTVTLFEHVGIPAATESAPYYDVMGYLLLDGTVGPEFQEQSFTIGEFLAILR